MQLKKAIETRRSIRKYKSKNPNWRTIIECIDSARYAPMAGNIFSLNFILIDDERIIKEIAKSSFQEFIAEAKYLMVFISNKGKTENSFQDRSEKYLKQQAGAAIQNFLLRLEEEGLSTCWIGLFDDDKIKSLLSIPDKHEIEAIFPIGYAAEKPKPRHSGFRDINGYLFFNKFKNKRMKTDNAISV